MEKFSNVELECSKKPNFIKFTTVDVWKTLCNLLLKWKKISNVELKCST